MPSLTNILVQTNSDMVVVDSKEPWDYLSHYVTKCREKGVSFAKCFSTMKSEWVGPQSDVLQKKTRLFLNGLGIVQNCMDAMKGGNKFDDFDSSYDTFKGKIGGYRNKPLFFVNSCNFAHHYSALFARWAFDSCGDRSKAKVVINIDQHCDFDNGSAITNSSWGNFLKLGQKNVYRVYIALGVARVHMTFGLFPPETNLDPHPVPVTGDYTKGKIILALNEYAEHLKGCDLFISVDRDVFNYSKTHFRAGDRTYNDAMNLLKDLLMAEALQGAKLRGGDVTGLTQRSKYNDVLASLDPEINDIANIHKYVSDMK